jgi:hypothetical protein
MAFLLNSPGNGKFNHSVPLYRGWKESGRCEFESLEFLTGYNLTKRICHVKSDVLFYMENPLFCQRISLVKPSNRQRRSMRTRKAERVRDVRKTNES